MFKLLKILRLKYRDNNSLSIAYNNQEITAYSFHKKHNC